MYTWNKNVFSLDFSLICQNFLSLILNNISIHYTFREHNGLFLITLQYHVLQCEQAINGKKKVKTLSQTAKNTLTVVEPVNMAPWVASDAADKVHVIGKQTHNNVY